MPIAGAGLRIVVAPGGVAADERLAHDVQRNLVADQQRVAGQAAQPRQAVADIAGFDRSVRARHDGDLVLAGRIHEDQSHARGLSGERRDHRCVHALGREGASRFHLERVVAQGADEERGSPQARGGHGLVAPLASVMALVAAARDGLSRVGQVWNARDKVNVDRADHDDAAAHLLQPPRWWGAVSPGTRVS